MENPKCPYCDREMDAKCHTFNMWDTKFYFECSCGSRTPMESTPEAAYAAAMKRDRVKGEWVHLKVRHSLPWDCPPYYGEEYDRESHSCLDDEWHCSNCDYITDEIDKEWMNFCPNCGADMREAKDDER